MIGELAALGAAISWTVSAVLYKKALAETKPLSANILRLTVTSAFLMLFVVLVGKTGALTSLPMNTVVLAGASGIVGLGLGDTLYMVSLKMIGVTRAVPITCTYPLFNLIWAIFLVGEPVTASVAAGAVVIVIGIWLVSREEQTEHADVERKTVAKGSVIALVTAFLWSISIAMIGIAVKETPSLDSALALNSVRVTAVALSMLIPSLALKVNLGARKMQKKTLIALIAGGLIALGVGWFLLTYSFINVLESVAVPISSTTPLFSTLSGIALLQEKATKKTVAGSVIIVAGIFLLFLPK